MHPNDYQGKAMSYARYSTYDYPFLALGEEAGEVQGKLAKAVRKQHKGINDLIIGCQDGTQPELRDDLISELGDVLWQLTACACALNTNINALMHSNLQKLLDRDARNVIVGEGDNR